jgi:hypothetical protein
VAAAFAEADAAELDDQRTRVAPHVAAKMTEATYSLRRCLWLWEGIAIIVSGEMPADHDQWFMLEEYVNLLVMRDDLEERCEALPKKARDSYRSVLDKIDKKFRDATIDDGGEAVGMFGGLNPQSGKLLKDKPELLASKPWWWHRRPEPLLWQGRYPDVPGEPLPSGDLIYEDDS